MRVGLDANISPKVARALAELYPAHDFETVGAGQATSDAPWIHEFANEGGDGYIGLDKQIHNRPHEVKALRDSGLNSCLFDFNRLSGLTPQAAVIIYVLPRIIKAWAAEGDAVVLRAKPTLNLNSLVLERLEFWLDDGQPRLRKLSVHSP